MPITEARCDFRSARRPRIASTKACGGLAGHSIASRSDDTFRMSSTLSQKVWERHVVRRTAGEPDLLYVDPHLVHEVTSPQAFEGLRLSKRRVRRPDLTLATMDHDVPTIGGRAAADEVAERQMSALEENCRREGIRLYGMGNARQGIVHVIGPELGLTQPGMLIVCGDSHPSTHGAFGALALGIGTSEVEHVLATQCLRQRRPMAMAVTVEGALSLGVTAKDVALGIIGRIGVDGGRGHVIEYRGSTIRELESVGRMKVCKLTIEGGARAGMVAPDETTFTYVKGRPHAPADARWERAIVHWKTLATDAGAQFDQDVAIDATRLEPYVTW